eukprot:m.21384 g.21384  ORF g.21384 m.21384 type:complete len:220 (+) comp7133_c0_seq1:117-776(+)
MTGASVVPHIRQRFNWDCGLACAQMVLNWHGIEASQESIEKSLKIKSVWTVDLCKCLAEYGLRTEYFTQVIGVNPEHETDSFYSAEFNDDATRVNNLFRNATESDIGFRVEEKEVELQSLLKHLQNGGVAIVLINNMLLSSPIMQVVQSGCCTCFEQRIPYVGHYIIVFSADERERILRYRDPASNISSRSVRFAHFEKARFSQGTDGDVVFIPPVVKQ